VTPGRSSQDEDFPWWLVIVAVTGLLLFLRVATDVNYTRVLAVMAKGIWVTIYVTLISYSLACLLGLGLALGQLSRWIALRQVSRLYVEVMRGIPIMVLLLYVAFALSPGLVWLWNVLTGLLGMVPATGRDFPYVWRAVIALTLAYASFLAEVFRAGLMSVDKGQIEAAEALGLSRWQRFRHIVFPQAFRTILPPLGNDFVAMIKDSSLVSVVGVADITQLGKTWAAGNYRYLETYNVMALIYLTMTICLSLALRRLERRLRAKSQR
jgi:polar amino acid transport system permease protein